MKGDVSVKKTYHWGIMGPGFIADKVLPDFSLSDGGKVLAGGVKYTGEGRGIYEEVGNRTCL